MVTDVAALFQLKLRSLASKPVILKADATDALSIASLKFTVMVALAVTPAAPLNGNTEATVGGVVSGNTHTWPEHAYPEAQSPTVAHELLQLELRALTHA